MTQAQGAAVVRPRTRWRFARRGGTRVLSILVTLFISSIVLFVALDLTPGSKVAALTGGRAVSPQVEHELVERFRLDDPLPVRYLHWLTDALKGDFGYSYVSQASVASLVGTRLAVSIQLLAIAMLLSWVVGILLGLSAGSRPGAVDTTILTATALLAAIPSFVLALVLISVLSVGLGLLPSFGAGDGLADRLEHLLLPAIAVSGASVAFVARLTRTAVRAEMGAAYVETAVSRGVRPFPTWRRHVVRTAAVPIVSSGAVVVAGLISTMVIVETAFSINGMGSLLVHSVQRRDFPTTQAIILLLVAMHGLLSVGFDLLVLRIDPRLRRGRS